MKLLAVAICGLFAANGAALAVHHPHKTDPVVACLRTHPMGPNAIADAMTANYCFNFRP